mmetsp:Transcript_7025/g.20724  ORF Transcript_7025/g.20724 Transcript_7025/m.20724 type:complete len:224 (+) Transcript_7025:607-1278(+)
MLLSMAGVRTRHRDAPDAGLVALVQPEVMRAEAVSSACGATSSDGGSIFTAASEAGGSAALSPLRGASDPRPPGPQLPSSRGSGCGSGCRTGCRSGVWHDMEHGDGVVQAKAAEGHEPWCSPKSCLSSATETGLGSFGAAAGGGARAGASGVREFSKFPCGGTLKPLACTPAAPAGAGSSRHSGSGIQRAWWAKPRSSGEGSSSLSAMLMQLDRGRRPVGKTM